jgi:hypothetical protein
MNSLNQNSIIVISWDGITKPLDHILFDVIPDFKIFIIDYSGINHEADLTTTKYDFYLSKKSECKGDLINNVYQYLHINQITDYTYIGLLDDDLYISINDLNKLLFIASLEKLDVFQASLTHDSYYHHRQFIYNPGYLIQETNWVEIMAPFYSQAVFNAAGPYLTKSISGTGTDAYLIPTIQQLIGKTRTAVIHGVSMKHCRPIRTGNRTFSNNKTCMQEIHEMQVFCKNLYRNALESKDFNNNFIKSVLNREFINGIPLKHKLARIIPMFKNIYKLLVDASYR